MFASDGIPQEPGLASRKTLLLAEALRVRRGEVVSLVGGGGKTSLMFRLARELSLLGGHVITTTTTRILPPASHESPCLIVEEDEAELIRKAREALESYLHITLARLMPEDNKLKGLLPETVDKLAGLGLVDYILNEADGAARQPVKAPNATEPVMPAGTSLVVAVVGIEAVGRPLSPDTAFRAERISHLTGLKEGELITVEAVATLLSHPQGIIQHAPPGARIIPFINKVEEKERPLAEELAWEVLLRGHPQIHEVVYGAVRRPEQLLTIVSRAI